MPEPGLSKRGESFALRVERLCGPLRFTDPDFARKCIVRQVYRELQREILTAREPCLLLTDPGGVGKSTFVNWLTYELLKRVDELGYLPLLVEIPQLGPGWEWQVILPQDALVFVLEGAGTAFLAALEGLRPMEARKKPDFMSKLKRIMSWLRQNLGRIEHLASFVDNAGEVIRGVLEVAPVATSLALTGLQLPVGLVVAAVLAAFSLKEAMERVRKQEHAFDILRERFSSLLTETVKHARKYVPKLRGILLIVDEAGDVRLDSTRAILLEGLALLAMSLEECQKEGIVFKVLVVRREFRTVKPHEGAREIRPLTRDERDIVEEYYRILEFSPLLSEEQEEFILRLARQLGLQLKEGQEHDIARELWGRYLGCPKAICMALVLASERKRSKLIELPDIKALPPHEKNIYRAVLRESMKFCPCGHEIPESMVLLAACASMFTREELYEALALHKPHLVTLRGDLDIAFDFLMEKGFLGKVGYGIVFRLEDNRQAKPVVLYELKPGEPYATAIRKSLLTPEDRAKIYACWVRALKAVAERQKARLSAIVISTYAALIREAVKHLEESHEAGLKPDSKVLTDGLKAASFLSRLYYYLGLPSPCVYEARLGIELARALNRPIDELDLMECLAHEAMHVGLSLPEFTKLMRRGQELVKRIETCGRPEEIDEARYHYCYIVKELALRLGGEEGLKLLDELERDYANKISDRSDRLDVKDALDDVRAKLLMDSGKLEEAERILKKRLERVKLLHEKGYLSERGYRHTMAVIESGLGELLFRRGGPEDIKEAREHHSASRQHCRAIGNMDGVARSLVNEALCLLALGEPEKAREARKLLLDALKVFERVGDQQGYCRSLGFMSLSCLIVGDDDTALRRAIEALRLAHEKLADMPFELAQSWLTLAYSCLVARKVPDELPDEVREKIERVEKPPGLPSWLRIAIGGAVVSQDIFEDLNALKAYLVRLVGLHIAGQVNFQELLEAFEEAHNEWIAGAGSPFNARIMSECLRVLRERRQVDEEFLRREFIRFLL